MIGELWWFFDDRIGFFEWCAGKGDATWVRLGPKRGLVLSHPDLLRELFVLEGKHFARGVTGAPMRPFLGNGLLLSEGEMWKRQRRDTQPLFGADRIGEWTPAIEGATDALTSRWHDGESRDVHHEMHRLTLDIAARLFFGVASDPGGGLHPALESVLRDQIFRVTLPLGPLRLITGSGPSRAAREFERLVHAALDRANDPGAPAPLRGIARAAATRREARDQLVTLIFTGQDTTAVALAWAWHLLSADERSDRALRSAIAAGCENEYVSAVVTETLRLYPPVLASAREATSDCEIGGQRVRKGDLVLFSQWIVQRDDRWFDRPAEFAPERWLDGLEDRLHPFAYFPFGAGRRNCVGRMLALAIATVAVPRIARRWRLVGAAQRPDLDTVITPRPRGGLPMLVSAA